MILTFDRNRPRAQRPKREENALSQLQFQAGFAEKLARLGEIRPQAIRAIVWCTEQRVDRLLGYYDHGQQGRAR